MCVCVCVCVCVHLHHCIYLGLEEASSKVELLLPYRDSDPEHISRQPARYERDEESQASGFASGSGTVDYPTTPITTEVLTIYIEITLKISIDAYIEQQDDIDRGVLEVLQTHYLSSGTATATVKRSAIEEHGIHLSLDMEKSSNDASVLRVVLVNSDTGEQNITATAQLYDKLASEPTKFIQELEKAIGIVSLTHSPRSLHEELHNF